MKKSHQDARKKRKVRIRKRIRGSQDRPRMSVFRSGRHIQVQIVDDSKGRVIASASTLGKAFGQTSGRGSNIASAKIVGAQIAEKALANDISQVVFDRNGFLYHGRVRAVATGAREEGLDF